MAQIWHTEINDNSFVNICLQSNLFSLLAFALFSCPLPTHAEEKCLFSLTEGETTQIEYKGFRKFIRIYVPAQAAPTEGYPVIFYYHGYSSGLRPNLQIMQAVTGGNDFVLVGINYRTRRFYEQLERKYVHNEVEHFHQLLKELSACCPVNREIVILAGYSQGGYAISLIGEQVLDEIAGMIFLGSGRTLGKLRLPEAEDIEGLPFFVAAGENDSAHLETAETTALLYALLGAKVSMERWPDTDHIQGWSWYQNDPARAANLRLWLSQVAHGEEKVSAEPQTSEALN